MIRIRCRHLLLPVLWALLAASDVGAQVLTAGSIHGLVLSDSGDPLRDARIIVTSQASGVAHEIRSDADGQFALRFIKPGEYDLLVELLGYVPKRLTDVPARSAAGPTIVVRLRGVSGPAQQVDQERYMAAAAISDLSSGNQWIGASRIAMLPHGGRTLGDLVRLSTVADEDLSVEGLPASLTTLRYAGVDWRPSFVTGAAAAVPLALLQAAELSTNGVDVEWGGAAGGILSGHAAAGAGSTRFDARSTFAGDALPGASIEPDAGWSEVQGEARVRGPVAGGRGGFTIGATARMLGSPQSAAWTGDAAAALIAAGVDPAGRLAAYTSPTVQEGSVVTAFGSFDVAGAHHALGGRVAMNTTSLDPVAGTTLDAQGSSALDLLGTVFLASAPGANWWNHAQLGLTHGSLERDSLEIAPLLVVPDGLQTALRQRPREVTRTEFTASDVLGRRFGTHDVKLGAVLRVTSYDYIGIHDTNGTHAFGGLDELITGVGSLVRVEPVTDAADWSTFGLSAFLQDRWRPGPDVELLIGVRLEAESLPTDDVPLDIEWGRLTGIANNAPDAPAIRLAPRAGLTWTPDEGRWRIDLATGIYDGRYDPELIAGWQVDAGTARVRRVAGALAWPPDGTVGGTTAVRLTVLDPDFAAPRSTRLSGGVARMLTTGTSVHVSAVIRRTDNLPRRTDLNLTGDPVAHDQYGRALYGMLVKQGGLLVTQPGTGRRFTEYDEVAAISADGESRFWGVTLGLDHVADRTLDLFARYTFSSTTDDWFAARQGGWSRTMPVGFDEWIDDTSDFDVPHRGVIGAVARAPFGLTLSALYRVQSGLPFTPGFRAGVDANGDGIPNNDPPFVDPTVPGMSELIDEWSCLSEAIGDFASRNSCRADPVHTLDASAAVRLFTVYGMAASVLVEAFDLLDAERRMPDDALYLVATDVPLDVNGGVVNVPLVANPDFGTPRAWPLSGRTLRLGLSLNW